MKRSLKLLSSMVGVLSLSAGLSLPAIAQQQGATPAQQVAPGNTPPADAGNQAPVNTPSGSQQTPGSDAPSAAPDTAEEQPSTAPYSPQRQQNGSRDSQNQAPSGQRNQTPETRNPAPAPGSNQSGGSDNQNQAPSGQRNQTPETRNPAPAPGSNQPGGFDNQNQAPANQTPGTRNPAPAPGSTQRQQGVTPGNQDPTQNGNNASPDTVEDQPSVAPFDQQRQRTGSPNPRNTAPSQRNQAPTDPNDTRRGASPDPIESLSMADSQGMTIDQVVDKSDSFRLFNALLRVAAIEEPDLVAKLSGNRDYTVFAPTDRAFLALPEGTITQLVKPENRALLVEVLSNHVVQGRVASNQMPGMTTSSSSQVQSNVPEAVGRAQPGATPNAPLSAVPGPISPEENTTRERSVSFSPNMGGNVQVVRPDVEASNGVIHVIDRVILPADIESRLVTSTSTSSR